MKIMPEIIQWLDQTLPTKIADPGWQIRIWAINLAENGQSSCLLDDNLDIFSIHMR